MCVSLLQLTQSVDGIQWKPLWPCFPGRPSSGLENTERIPGTNKVLLVESGEIFFETDDENYGGTLRPLPIGPMPSPDRNRDESPGRHPTTWQSRGGRAILSTVLE